MANPALAQLGAGLAMGGTQATIGLAVGAVANKRARQQLMLQLEEIESLNLPPEEKMRMSEDMVAQYKQFAPEALGPSAMESVSTDPRTRAAQLSALEQLTGLSQGGLTDQAKMEMAQAQQMAGQQARAQREAAQGAAARRGIGGSGIDLATQAMGDQNVYGQNYMAGMQGAAMSEQARRSALEQMSGLAGQMRGQDFSEAAEKATAADRIKQFNAAARNNFNQNMMDAKQNALSRNADVTQQAFNNRLNKQKLKSGARSDLYGHYSRIAQGGLGMGSAGMQGAGQAVSAYSSQT